MKTEKTNNRISNIISVTIMALVYAVAVFMIAYLVYNVFDANYIPVKTEETVMKTVDESVRTKVFIVRDENYLSGKASGTVVPLVEDGQRVADGERIAAVFAGDEEAGKFVELNRINEEIERFTNIAEADKLNIRDMGSYNQTTNETFLTLVETIADGNYSDVSDFAYSVRDRETSRQVSLGYDVDTTEILQSLKAEASGLSATEPSYLIADNTGYYISSTDGYENTLKYADVLSLTTDDIEKALKAKADESKISESGKLVNNFNWYVVAVVNRNDVDESSVGDTVTVRFTDSAAEDVKMTIAAINSDSAGKVALILKSNSITAGTSQLRIENAEIILKKISGYKIPKVALRTVDGINGVYIKRGNLINFRRITVLYTGDDYVIARTYEAENASYEAEIDEIEAEKRLYKAQLSDRSREEPEWIVECEDLYSRPKLLARSYIKLYDEVIVEGNGLYDNKIV